MDRKKCDNGTIDKDSFFGNNGKQEEGTIGTTGTNGNRGVHMANHEGDSNDGGKKKGTPDYELYRTHSEDCGTHRNTKVTILMCPGNQREFRGRLL